MMFRDLCAVLCNKPYSLRPWEVAQLTPRQVKELYLCDRDEEGRVTLTPRDYGPEPTPREWFFDHWRQYGLRDDLIEKLWNGRTN